MSTIHKVIYTCEEATKLMIQEGDGKLSRIQKLRIWMHLQLCGACKTFDIQNKWIDAQIHKLAQLHDNIHLSEEQKSRLAEKLLALKQDKSEN